MTFEPEPIQFSLSEEALWAAVYTQPLHEFRLYRYFQEHGIPAYLPVVPEIKQHRVHTQEKLYSYQKTVWRPMFRSYVFAQMTEDQKNDSYRSHSIIRIWPVAREDQSAFLDELRGVRMMEQLAKTAPLEFRQDIQVKDRFLIESPPYEGTYGYLLEKRKQFLWVVKIELFNTAIVAEIDPADYKMTKVE